MRIRKAACLIVSVINQLSRIAGLISIIFLLAMMVVTVSDVFLRFFFGSPITGSVELNEYFMVVAGFLGLGWCATKGGHLKVDLIMNNMSPRIQAITDSITLVFGTAVVALATWRGFVQARNTQIDKVTSDVLGIPAYPFYVALGVGFTILFLVLMMLLTETIRKAIYK